MQKYFITLTCAVAFLVATNVQAGILISSWDAEQREAVYTDRIVTFSGNGGTSFNSVQAGENYRLVSDMFGGTISSTYDIVNVPAFRMHPAEMGFAILPGANSLFDTGFDVRVTASNWDSFMNALTIQVFRYNDNSLTTGNNIFDVKGSDLAWTQDIAVAGTGWLNGLGDVLMSHSDGLTYMTFYVNPAYAGTFGIEVHGATVPEPATLAMLGLGLAGLGVARRRMKK